MVWCKQQFEREVCRQMVELESIRKRIVPDEDVLERIDRLEESHRHLLRRLNECVAVTRVVARGGLAVSERRSLARRRCARGACREKSAKMGVRTARITEASSLLKGSSLLMTGIAPPPTCPSLKALKAPSLHQKCGTCGKVLLSSILAGDEVLLQKETWHHKGCAELEGVYRKPHLRN